MTLLWAMGGHIGSQRSHIKLTSNNMVTTQRYVQLSCDHLDLHSRIDSPTSANPTFMRSIMQTLGSHKDTRQLALEEFYAHATCLCAEMAWVIYKRGRG